MPRLILGDLVWAVHQTGKSLVIEDGKKTTERKFVSEDASAKMLEKLVAEKLAAGYVPFDDGAAVAIVDGQTVLRSPELEAAIRANPDDRDAYLVYADWLQSRGDPRGELIAQMVNGIDPMPLLKKHKKAFYGALINRIVPPHDKPPMLWRNGFIHRLEVEREKRYRPVSPTVGAVAAHASGALLSEVTIGSDDPADIAASVAHLVAHAPPLRVLELRSYGDLGDLAPALQTFRALRRLVVKKRARDGRPSGLAPNTMRAVAMHAPPTVEHLVVRSGDGGAGFGDLAPLFRRTDLTNLAHLTIRDVRFGEALADAILAAPFASQLVTIDLVLTELPDDAVTHLAALPAVKEVVFTTERCGRYAGSDRTFDVTYDRDDHDIDEMMRARFRPGFE